MQQINLAKSSQSCQCSFIFRFVIHLLDRWFRTDVAPPAVWTHVVLNYLGPEEGEGIRVYYNGVQTGSDDTERLSTFQAGVGRVAVGRLYTDTDSDYPGVDVDELMFFNESLSSQQILDLANMV